MSPCVQEEKQCVPVISCPHTSLPPSPLPFIPPASVIRPFPLPHTDSVHQGHSGSMAHSQQSFSASAIGTAQEQTVLLTTLCKSLSYPRTPWFSLLSLFLSVPVGSSSPQLLIPANSSLLSPSVPPFLYILSIAHFTCCCTLLELSGWFLTHSRSSSPSTSSSLYGPAGLTEYSPTGNILQERLGHRTDLSEFERTEIIQSMFFDHIELNGKSVTEGN